MEIDFGKYPAPETEAMIKENGLSCKCADKPKELCRRLEQQKAALEEKLENLCSIAGNFIGVSHIYDNYPFQASKRLVKRIEEADAVLKATKGNK